MAFYTSMFVNKAQCPDGYEGPRIAMIHGFLERQHMQANLLRFAKEADFPDSSLYGYRFPVEKICDDLCVAASAGRAIAVIGFSQGGFHAVKIANELNERGITLPLMVVIGAGGLGRAMPMQWGADPRKIPANVQRCINSFAIGDILGSDLSTVSNLLRPLKSPQYSEDIYFQRSDCVSHLALTTCYPEGNVNPSVKKYLLDRITLELNALKYPL